MADYLRSDHVPTDDDAVRYDDLVSSYGWSDQVADRLTSLDPVMRNLMEAARPGLGEYTEPPAGGWSYQDNAYWQQIVRDRVLRAIGIHELGEEAQRRMRPDSPDLIADQLHPWVWEAAAPLWNAGSRQEAVHGGARSVNARDAAETRSSRQVGRTSVPRVLQLGPSSARSASSAVSRVHPH